jgi:isopenicillin N synthase-like dioxygenase
VRDGILTVPVIDITSFRMPYADVAARSVVVRQVDAAARTVGFMQITGHGIPSTTRSEFTSATDAFFALDARAKARYRCPPGINRGYTPPKAESLANSLGLASAADLFEAINVGTCAADFPGLDLPEDVYAANVYPSAEVPASKPPSRPGSRPRAGWRGRWCGSSAWPSGAVRTTSSGSPTTRSTCCG